MNTTRNGKIARLPRTLRDELSQRIDNGVSGPKLAAWLNTLPEVKTILAEYFDAIPINVQNISQWRKGGYQEWHDLQEIRQTTRELATDASLLDQEITPQKISETYATVTAADFVRTSRAKLKACQDLDQRWKCLDEVEKRLSRFRRDDHRASHVSIRASQASLRRERWTAEEEDRETAATQAAETEQRRHMLTYFDLQPELLKLGQQNCGNEKGYDRAVFILELRHNLPIGFLDEKPPTLFPNSEGRVPRVPNITSASEPPTAPTPADDTAHNPRSPQYETPPSIKAKTPSETPEIKPNQSPYERINSPQNEPPIRPTCQLHIPCKIVKSSRRSLERNRQNPTAIHANPKTLMPLVLSIRALASWSACAQRRFPHSTDKPHTARRKTRDGLPARRPTNRASYFCFEIRGDYGQNQDSLDWPD